jgi:hypothetical protein
MDIGRMASNHTGLYVTGFERSPKLANCDGLNLPVYTALMDRYVASNRGRNSEKSRHADTLSSYESDLEPFLTE